DFAPPKTTIPGLYHSETERRPARQKPAAPDFFLWPQIDFGGLHRETKNPPPPVLRCAAVLRIQAVRRAVLLVSRQAGEWFSGQAIRRRKDGSITWNRNETREWRL